MDTNLEHERHAAELKYLESREKHFERLEFVKHICDIMIESRYEHTTRRHWFVFADDVESLFEQKPLCDEMPGAAFDLMPGDPFANVACGNYAVLPGTNSPADRISYLEGVRVTNVALPNGAAILLIDLSPNGPPTPNLSRGSPQFQGLKNCRSLQRTVDDYPKRLRALAQRFRLKPREIFCADNRWLKPTAILGTQDLAGSSQLTAGSWNETKFQGLTIFENQIQQPENVGTKIPETHFGTQPGRSLRRKLSDHPTDKPKVGNRPTLHASFGEAGFGEVGRNNLGVPVSLASQDTDNGKGL